MFQSTINILQKQSLRIKKADGQQGNLSFCISSLPLLLCLSLVLGQCSLSYLWESEADSEATPFASPVKNFVAATESNSGISIKSTDGSYSLSWEGAEEADSYQLEESSDGGENWLAVSSYDGISTNHVFSEREGELSYTYRVRQCFDGQCDDWTHEITVRVSLPASDLESNVRGVSLDGIYTLFWDTLPQMNTSYELEERSDSRDSNNAPITMNWRQLSSLNADSYSIPADQPKPGHATYFYRLRACNSQANCGEWSSRHIIEVTLIQPTGLVSDKNLSYDGSYRLSWNTLVGIPYELTYNLQENLMNIYQGTASETEARGREIGSYSYRVQACSMIGCGHWSREEVTVSVRRLGAPTGIMSDANSPFDGDGNYTISWNSLNEVIFYELEECNKELCNDEENWNGVNDTEPGDLRAVFSGKAEGTYLYRLRGCREMLCGPWGNFQPRVNVAYLGSEINPHIIRTYTQLTLIGSGIYKLSDHYRLDRNIDASASCGEDCRAPSGNGFTPIGTQANKFRGHFDGAGHTINRLYIDRDRLNYAALFSYTENADIRNLGLLNANIKGNYSTGGLVGDNQGSILNSHVTGNIQGDASTGGLVGTNHRHITNSYAAANTSGAGSRVGGLVGKNKGTILNCHTSGTVTGTENEVGGLVGWNDDGNILNSYAVGNIKGGESTGGLVGSNHGRITNSYAAATTNGTGSRIGGLVGNNSGTILNCYASGTVTGTENEVGGLAGWNQYGSSISNSYATGDVKGAARVGGIVGVHNYGSIISNNYATGDVEGNNEVGGLVGKNSSYIGGNNYFVDSDGNADGLGTRHLCRARCTQKTAAELADYDNRNAQLGASWAAVNWDVRNDEQGQHPILKYSCSTPSAHTSCGHPIPGQGLDGSGTQTDPYILRNYYHLTRIGQGDYALDNYYKLSNSINANISRGSCTAEQVNNGNDCGSGFTPIGSNSPSYFGGNFDGNGYTIRHLYVRINQTGANDAYAGLFQRASGATIKNVGLVNVYISASSVLAGRRAFAGGLVGYNNDTVSITNSYATGKVSAFSTRNSAVYAGGLVGYNSSRSSVSNSYALVSVSSFSNVGVSAGGLIGYNLDSSIRDSYATGLVSVSSASSPRTGGLVGENSGTASITNSYATGGVSASGMGFTYAGGLLGVNGISSDATPKITNSYAAGSVSASSATKAYAGGLMAYNDGSVIGKNYFASSEGGSDGIGNGSCTGGGMCIQATGATQMNRQIWLRNNIDEGRSGLDWNSDVWGSLDTLNVFPCLKNMPSGAPDCS